jgi:hypothetical protein
MRWKDTRWGRRVVVGLIVVALSWGVVGFATAEPVYIVDTGPGASTSGLSLTRTQYLAGQFTLDLDHEINELEGWMIYPTIMGDLPVQAVLYGDLGGFPDLADEIHRQLFTVPASGIPFAADWHGIGGLALEVMEGTYWLAFEVPTDNFGSGAMPPTPLQELDLYAVDSGGSGYSTNVTAKIGIRILPEPGLATMLACGVGFLALGIGSSKKR